MGYRLSEADAGPYRWQVQVLDPIMTITLRLSNPQDTVPLFFSLFALFKWTFFDTVYLKLSVDYEPDDGPEVFLPLDDSFRGFVKLEVMCLGFCFEVSVHPFTTLPAKFKFSLTPCTTVLTAL